MLPAIGSQRQSLSGMWVASCEGMIDWTPNMRPLIALLLCLAWPLPAQAGGEIQPLESIRAAALAALEDGIQADLRLDSSLRMPRCAVPLTAQRQGSGTLEVVCPQQWRLYVPVKLQRPQRVLVLTRSVAAGEVVGADVLVQQTRDTSRIVGTALSEPAAAIGQVARRALAAGSVLTAAHLRAPRLVRRGESVVLIARHGGALVRMAGRALGDAGAGERVSVLNLSSRRTIQGRVLDDGGVLVN